MRCWNGCAVCYTPAMPMSELDDDTAASIASVESVEMGNGAAIAKRLKMWDKVGALEKAAKILSRPFAMAGRVM